MVAKVEQGAEEGGEDIWSNAMEVFPDGVGDAVRTRGGGGRAF